VVLRKPEDAVRSALFAAAAVCGLALAAPAMADPCTAVPDRGSMPAWLRSGASFSGPVTYVGDGDGLCVAAVRGREDDPSTWVEVRLSDFYAPELSESGGRAARDTLRRLVMGRRVSCVAGRRSWDRVVAACRLNGVEVAELMRRQGVVEGGRGRLSR